MGHPVIEEINRCWSVDSIQNHAFRRWQRVLRDEVQAELDRVTTLEALVASLSAENDALKAQQGRRKKVEAPAV